MILVTVGTHEQPFDRLLNAVLALETDERMVVQYGTSTISDGPGEWIDYMSFDELAALAAEARVLICHAGVGSIVVARRCGHRPIVMSRRPELGEHVDEHQIELTRRLGAAGLVTVADDAAALAAAVASPPGEIVSSTKALSGPSALSADVRGALDRLGARRLSAHAA